MSGSERGSWPAFDGTARETVPGLGESACSRVRLWMRVCVRVETSDAATTALRNQSQSYKGLLQWIS